ncbi:MAG: GTP cyclohydrolase I FolE [Chloroflexi bacterium]|nr:GTP cyclohydrolase I FolE [Chloroflexota bacterium]
MDKHEQAARLNPLLREVLELLGEDPDREGLRKTPQRWAEALLTYTEGNHIDPQEHLKVIFQLDEDDYPQDSDDMVLVDNIEFTSTCEHHLAPFRGVVHIAYIPNAKKRVITGLSKLSRVVETFARRLQVQERMTQQIANAIDEHLKPLGVIVVVQAMHYCMVARGVQQRSSLSLTTARRGLFHSNQNLEAKFQAYLKLRMDSSKV